MPSRRWRDRYQFMMFSTSRWQGVAWVVLSATGFGAMAIFAKLAYQEQIDLPTLLFLRFVIAGGLLALWLVLRGQHWPRGSTLVWLVIMGAVGYVGQSFSYFSALQHASAGVVALLLYLYPAIVVLMSALLFKRHLGRGRVWAVCIALAGTALTVGGDLHSEPIGIAFGIAAAVIYSAYILLGERVMAGTAPLQASTIVMLSAAFVYGAISVPSGLTLPSSMQGWFAVLAIAIFSTLLAILGFFKGMAQLGAADASTLSTLEPLITLALAAWILGETVSNVQLLGGGLILLAVIYLARAPATP